MSLPLNDIKIIFYRISKQLTKTVLQSAGIHGDEPSGVETICTLLENNRFEIFSDEWELTIFPCINPYGYEYGTRQNQDGKVLN
jgi:murein peptide amidase A